MENCACPHAPAEHAPFAEFGASICLVRDCDCNGTHEQVAAQVAAREARRNVPEALTAVILSVLSNPMKRTPDDQARNVAQAVLGHFELEPR